MIHRTCYGLIVSLLFSLVMVANTDNAKAAAKPSKPNILWIIGEDLGPELGCYGTPQVWTPHLDKLAKSGMRFTNAFTTAPVCSASRSAFMTGMYQTSIGAHNHRSHRRDNYRLPKGVRLMTHRLQDAGYFTANLRHISKKKNDRFFRGTGKTDWNFNITRKPFDSDRWDDLKSHQPFYAQINFSETHRGGAWNNAHQHIAKTADPAKVKLPPYYPDHPVARKDWAQYLNTVMALDRKVGMVLARLEEDGLAENTIVIFMGDHGRAMVRGKQWCYDSGLHIPLIIRWPKEISMPKQFKPGTVSDQLISALDLTATTLAYATGGKPKNMQGRVFFGPKAEPAREYVYAARDRCDETVFRIRTVRNKRYRYIRNFMPERPFLQRNRYKEKQYPVIALMRTLHAQGKLNDVQKVLMAPHRPAEELYDIKNDPYEIHNLANSLEHQAILKTFRAKLNTWIEETNDLGRIPESKEILEYWERVQSGKHVRKKKSKKRKKKSGRKNSSVFAPGAKPEMILKTGAGEGPAWHPKLGLLMSGGGHIYRFNREGKLSIFRKGAGTNGLLFDANGNLLACEPKLRRVTRMTADGKIQVLTAAYQKKRYNQPNDITVDSKGRIYFSDPKYGPRTDMEILDANGKKIEGVYRIDPDGSVHRIITHEVDRPNGVLVTPDDKFLYIADNNNNTKGGARKLWRYRLKENGDVDPRSKTLIHDWGTGRGPDGMVLDAKGRLYIAGGLNKPNPPYETVDADNRAGVYVFNPQGRLIDFVAIPRDEVTNCTFGGDDLKTLYITAGGTLWSIRTKTAGQLPWPKLGK
ncbi:MAG: hypothetical protein Tsb009_11270 [Planctomycetaceae bacterium]